MFVYMPARPVRNITLLFQALGAGQNVRRYTVWQTTRWLVAYLLSLPSKSLPIINHTNDRYVVGVAIITEYRNHTWEFSRVLESTQEGMG
jgi:hypothetical protein